ncbi:MAG: UDP-N-acetylmuramate dehydrogenase [Bradyrhizobiaceae bacterium]|nr:UDP-N-acetylmuramate dehydrogenase [Bradyrhizobiaceae bacterium]
MNVEHHVDLAAYTTFGVSARASTVVTVTTTDELREALLNYPQARLMGGGSNILVTQDVDVPVIRIASKGIVVVSEADEFVLVEVQAGELWHDLVTWAVDHDYGGLENLALIPGTVGAAPMQNIGAYGVEQNLVFHSLTALDVADGSSRTFTGSDCEFGYRSSVFKTTLRGRYAIATVTYRLTKPPHNLHTGYADVAARLQGHEQPTLRDVYNAVVSIRRAKLPDPKVVGNAGSFFKNPVIDVSTFQALLAEHPTLPSYLINQEQVKVPAAWLIDHAGWKGYREGSVGVHHNQALVLVNHGGGSGREVLQLSKKIQRSVEEKYGILLEPEVNLW